MAQLFCWTGRDNTHQSGVLVFLTNTSNTIPCFGKNHQCQEKEENYGHKMDKAFIYMIIKCHPKGGYVNANANAST